MDLSKFFGGKGKEEEYPESYTISVPNMLGRDILEKITYVASLTRSTSLEGISCKTIERGETSHLRILIYPFEFNTFKTLKKNDSMGHLELNLEEFYSEITLKRDSTRYASTIQTLASELEKYLNLNIYPKQDQPYQEGK